MSLIERHQKAAELLPSTGSLIGGERYTAGSTGTFDHINPSTGKAQASIPLSGADAVDAAVAAARAAAPGWRDTPGTRRRQILEKLAELLVSNGEELAKISALENGVTMGFGATRFVVMANEWTRYYAGWCDKLSIDSPTAIGPSTEPVDSPRL